MRRRTNRLEIVCTDAETALLQEAAARAEMELRPYVRAAALEKAWRETRIPAIYRFQHCRVCGYPVDSATIHQECLAKELKLPDWTHEYPAVIVRAAVDLAYRVEVATAQTADERDFLVRLAAQMAGLTDF
jgi:hypothetical protein